MGLGEGGEMPDGGTATLWEDDDMRAFYENFPELKALIPSILYSDSEKPTTTPVRIQHFFFLILVVLIPLWKDDIEAGCFRTFHELYVVW